MSQPTTLPPCRKRRVLTPADIQDVCRLYNAGITIAEIVGRLGFSQPTVSRTINRQRLRRRLPGVAPAEAAEMVRRYCLGETPQAIGQAMGRGKNSVLRAVRQERRPVRTQSEAGRVRRGRRLDETCFEQVNSPQKAYALGFIATDGHVPPGRSLVVSVQRQDRTVLDFFRGLLRSDAAIADIVEVKTWPAKGGRPARTGTYYRSTVCFSSFRLAESLSRLGLGGDKTFTVRPWEGPEALLPYFWAGAVDGDGCIDFQRRRRCRGCWRVRFYGNHFMVDGFRLFVESRLGFRANLLPHGSIWVVTYGSCAAAAAVAELLYANTPFALNRKRERAFAAMRAGPGPAGD